MSRFYETLKAASNIQPPAEASTGTAWGIDSLELPGVETTPIGVDPMSPAAAQESPTHFAEQMLSEFEPAGKDVLAASPANVVLDARTPLIPHAATSAVLEHYRRLRTNILQQHETKAIRTLMVVSPAAQDGKTTTVLNLGLTFAMLPSYKVLLLDADMRCGSLGQLLGVEDRPGFSNLIDGSARLGDIVCKSEELGVHFVTRGTSTRPAAELLQSANLRSNLSRLAENFDLVLVDSPPVNVVVDAQLLAPNCDAVLLVARAFSTTRKNLEKAANDLRPYRVIGTVLNAGTTARSYGRYKSYGRYQ